MKNPDDHTFVPLFARIMMTRAFSSFYFETLGYTESWLDITPPPVEGEPLSPISLNVTVRYRGRPTDDPLGGPPLAVILRAQSNPQYQPHFLRQPIFAIYADDERVWDPAQRIDFHPQGSPCDGCALSAEVVEVVVPVDALRRLGRAGLVTGNAFGFAFALDRDQGKAIDAFVQQVLGSELR